MVAVALLLTRRGLRRTYQRIFAFSNGIGILDCITLRRLYSPMPAPCHLNLLNLEYKFLLRPFVTIS